MRLINNCLYRFPILFPDQTSIAQIMNILFPELLTMNTNLKQAIFIHFTTAKDENQSDFHLLPILKTATLTVSEEANEK
jgi:hypothetical protein